MFNRDAFLKLLLISLLLMPAGCSQMEVIKWREEVKLNNGSTITVYREESFVSAYDGNGVGGMLKNEKLSFQASSAQRVEWSGSRMRAISLGEDEAGKFYIVANFENDAARRRYPVEVGFHIAFKYVQENSWLVVPMEDIPQSMKTNLLINPADRFLRDKKPMSEIISMDTKEQVNSSNASFDKFYNFQKK